MSYELVLFDKALDLVIGGFLLYLTWRYIETTIKKIENFNKLKDYGVIDIFNKGAFRKQELKRIFDSAIELRLCFATGQRFTQRNLSRIKTAINRKEPLRIKFLVLHPESQLFEFIEDIEKASWTRSEEETKLKEFMYVIGTLLQLKNINIEIRLNRGMVFLPFSIAYFTDKDNQVFREAHINLYVPPRIAADSLTVMARADAEDFDRCIIENENGSPRLKKEERNIVLDLEANFDYIYSNTSESIENYLLTHINLLNNIENQFPGIKSYLSEKLSYAKEPSHI